MSTLRAKFNAHWPAAAALIVGAAIMSVGLWTRSFWTDEWYAFRYFDLSFVDFIRDYWADPDNHPPGYYALVWAAVRVFGHHDWAVRLPGMLGGFAALLLVYKIVRVMAPRARGAAITAVVAAASAPYLVMLTQTARYFSLSAAAALFCAYALMRFAQSPRRIGWLYGFAAGTVFAGYLDYPTLAYIAISGAVAVLLTAFKHDFWRILRHYAAGQVAAVAVFLPLLPIFLPEVSAEGGYGADVLSSGPLAWLGRIGVQIYAALWGSNSLPWNWWVTLAIILAALLWCAGLLRNRPRAARFFETNSVRVADIFLCVGFAANTLLLSALPRYSPPAFSRYNSFVIYLFFALLIALTWRVRRFRAAIVALILIVHTVGLVRYARAEYFWDASFFTRDRDLYRVVQQQARAGDYLAVNEDLTLTAFAWYRDRYFSGIIPLHDVAEDFFAVYPSARVWVLGYGFDDQNGARMPEHKADYVLSRLAGGSARVSGSWYAGKIDERLRAVKRRVTGYQSYPYKTGLFLIERNQEL